MNRAASTALRTTHARRAEGILRQLGRLWDAIQREALKALEETRA